jgi:gamma-glutamyl-gamma-aminobutyrate hydrolase PuuD
MGNRVGLTFRFPKKAGPYAEAVRRAGVEPVLISPEAPIPIAGLDGLLISGGSDVDPARYGEEPYATTDSVDRERDAMEAALIEQALQADLPLLAICRGLQLLNVVRGGTLVQHLENTELHRVKNLAEVHLIEVVPGTKLASIIGTAPQIVNSRHHQAVGRLGEGLRVSATAPDGVVEALEDPLKRFVVAVQWHPEERIDLGAHDRALFVAFAAALEPRG